MYKAIFVMPTWHQKINYLKEMLVQKYQMFWRLWKMLNLNLFGQLRDVHVRTKPRYCNQEGRYLTLPN